MRQALQEGHAGAVVKKIIAGDLLEVIGVDDDGAPIVGETKNADRLKAVELAAKYVEPVISAVVDLTPREPASLTAGQLLDALPRLVRVLPGAAKVLEAIEVTGGVVD
jgi:hypothetical protein